MLKKPSHLLMISSQKQKKGFTLIELLIVVVILGLLMSILLPALSSVLFKSKQKMAIVDISQIETALASYHSDFRDFPPSTVKELGIKNENNINSGNEALVLCLSSTLKTDTYLEFRDDNLDNTDSDSSPIPLNKLTGSSFQTKDLLELLDPWGDPYVYFHSRNLNIATQHTYQINGAEQQAKPHSGKTKTGNFPGYGKYQIISLGGDMKVNTEDDVYSK